ncbi:MAG: glycosyltransferase family 2 protein [Candidatus Limnocylindrales bacterium]
MADTLAVTRVAPPRVTLPAMDRRQQVAETAPPEPGSVLAVVVAFHPKPDLASELLRLLNQVSAIVVVDNGSCPGELPAGDDPRFEGRLEIIANGENRGLATALNQGLRRARERGAGWALTLDQDSAPLPNLVAAGAGAFDAHPNPERLAVIGATVASEAVASAAATDGPRPASAPAYRTMKAVITSGTLHSVPTWERLGEFRDDFFIDCVDTEFCLRARAAGFDVIQSTEPALAHRIGSPTRKWALGRWMLPSNHSPFRRYYMTRNHLSLWRNYVRSDGRFVAQDIRQSVREWIGIVFAESDRPAKLRAILAGVRDAALGRYGSRRLPGSPH